MRTFHTGGVAGEADITRGLPRIEEVFERRAPKGEAEMCLKDGKVIEVDDKTGLIRVMTIKDNDKKKEDDVVEYKVSPNIEILVKADDTVKRGQPLCAGSIDLKKLFKLLGKKAVQDYVIKEIQKVYVSQGVSINDKHVEVIVRQMFSRVRVRDGGDSRYSQDEIISRAKYLEENEALENAGKVPMKADDMLLGVSKVALNTDSFLSAASFQETSRVLIEASLRGQEDSLKGLKENVIIGKLVPIGTGLRYNKGDK
jgi:DNA-directed RNA polymerase subunit beta'